MNEKALIAAFERVVRAEHANPQRHGCPGTSVLRQLAERPETFGPGPVLRHIGQCAPCLRELKELRRPCGRCKREIA
jgi:hypothetical protein